MQLNREWESDESMRAWVRINHPRAVIKKNWATADGKYHCEILATLRIVQK